MTIIIISEVNLIKDYVELKNNDSVKINLRGWKILDTTPTNQRRHEFIFQKDFFLQPSATVKIWSCAGNNDASNIYQNRSAKIWNNPGDTAELYDADRNLVDKKSVGNPPKGGRGGGAKPPRPPTLAKITISGYANDAECKQPIQNAKLVFQVLKGQKEAETNTDETGYYKTELNGGRDYTVTVSAKNYDDFSDTINTKVGKDMTKNFKLEPNLEIELDVDSAKVKFTRKDDNLINSVRQLAKNGKITVDINSDYVISVSVSVSKGKTKGITPTLIETGYGKTRKLIIPADINCRINEDLKNLVFTFNQINKNWTWHKEDLFGSHSDKTEKTFNYAVELTAAYGNNSFGPQQFPLGKIIVRVNKDKLNAQTAYNALYFVSLAMAIAALIAICIAIPPVGAALAGALSIGVISATSLVAAAGLLGRLSGLTFFATQFFVTTMNDPPKFNTNYRRVQKIKLLPSKKSQPIVAELKNFITIKKALMTCRDKLYSAQRKSDKSATAAQKNNMNHLLKLNDDSTTKLSGAVKKLKINSELKINTNQVKKTMALLRKNKLPIKLVSKKLKKLGLSPKHIKLLFKALTSRKVNDTSLTLNSAVTLMNKSLKNADRSFVSAIKKDVQ